MLSHQQARAFYDRFGAKQDSQRLYEDPATRVLVAQAHFEEAKAVFEFGCGTGRFAETLLADYLPQTAHYVGCDVSSTMVDLARHRLARFADRVEIRLTDGSPAIAAADAAFDRFVSNYVFDLLTPGDIALVLAEAHRVLTTDGRVCLSDLTHGTTAVSQLVMWAWTRIHRFRPQLVGGCRPVAVVDHLPEENWHVDHHRVIVSFGVPSEVLVAKKRQDTAVVSKS